MREPGFQLRAKDPPLPENVPFTLELWHDGEFLDRVDADTGWSDGALESLIMSRWVKEKRLPLSRARELLRIAKDMRDARRPR